MATVLKSPFMVSTISGNIMETGGGRAEPVGITSPLLSDQAKRFDNRGQGPTAHAPPVSSKARRRNFRKRYDASGDGGSVDVLVPPTVYRANRPRT